MPIKSARVFSRSRPPRSPSPPPWPPRMPVRAKLRCGPRNLLNTAQSNPKTADIEQANSTTSPLLKLPSEVRNRIYEHVFGIGVLHIGTPQQDHWLDLRALPKAICYAEEHELDAAKLIRQSQDLNVEDLFTVRHDECFHSADGAGFWKILNILSVCRQIHREAALLPYQLNIFYFNHFYNNFSRFREGLVPAQRKEIRSIGLFLNNLVTPNPEELKLYDMPNVRDLSIFVHHTHHDSPRVAAWLARDDKGNDDLGHVFFNHVKRAALDLRSVFVMIYPHDAVGKMVSVEEFKEWSVYVEEKLLEVGEGPGEHTKKMTRSGTG